MVFTKDKYTIMDIGEAVIGSIVGMLFFYVLGTTPMMSPIMGSVLTITWVLLFYFGLTKYKLKNIMTAKHVFADYFITLIISVLMALVFGTITFGEIFTLSFFGSTPLIISWFGLPIALLFDMYNMRSISDRWLYIGNNGGDDKKLAKMVCYAKYNNKEQISKCMVEVLK